MAELVPIRKSKSIFDEVERMHDRIMRRAYDIFTSNGSPFGRDFEDWMQAERELVWKPAIGLTEKDDVFQLQLAAPGVDPKNLDIEVTSEDILIRADVHHEHRMEEGEVYICEFAHGNLFRSVHLPKKIEPDKVKAEFKNGLLTLNAPVAEEARAKKVTVEAA
jgi:HSP20 family molecular chaperone IbpA